MSHNFDLKSQIMSDKPSTKDDFLPSLILYRGKHLKSHWWAN